MHRALGRAPFVANVVARRRREKHRRRACIARRHAGSGSSCTRTDLPPLVSKDEPLPACVHSLRHKRFVPSLVSTSADPPLPTHEKRYGLHRVGRGLPALFARPLQFIKQGKLLRGSASLAPIFLPHLPSPIKNAGSGRASRSVSP